jgi:hypothetical protein
LTTCDAGDQVALRSVSFPVANRLDGTLYLFNTLPFPITVAMNDMVFSLGSVTSQMHQPGSDWTLDKGLSSRLLALPLPASDDCYYIEVR